jgi:hypothetical protein
MKTSALKKLYFLVCILVMMSAFAACSNDNDDNGNTGLFDPGNPCNDDPIENVLNVDSTKKTSLGDLVVANLVRYVLSQKEVGSGTSLSKHKDVVLRLTNDLINTIKIGENNGCDSIIDYSVTFNSTGIDGKELLQSGKITAPTKDVPLRGIIISSRITITNDADAPSRNFQLESILAPLGYAVVIADGIGFGKTVSMPQTYMIQERTAKSGIDLELAAYDFLKKSGYTFKSSTNDVWLTGYSQGGSTAIASQKLIEEKYADKFNIKHTYCGGGCYDLSETMRLACVQDSSSLPVSLAPIVYKSYDYVYGLSMDFSKIFKSDLLENYDYWYTSKKFARADITTMMNASVLSDIFTQDALNPDSELMKQLYEKMEENNLCNWAPKAPIWMIHTTQDNYVNFKNAQNAIDGFKKYGATADIETAFGDYGSHIVCFVYYLCNIMEKLK